MQDMSASLSVTHPNATALNREVRLEDRVSIRNFSRQDDAHFYVWASDPEVTKVMTWDTYMSRDEVLRFLTEVAEPHPWFKAICLDGIPIGSITLTPGKGLYACKAELGFVLARSHWGKGITTLAVKNALKAGFSELGVHRIEAFVDPENKPSQKVLIKAGLTCEGLLKKCILFKGSVRDRYIYSLTNSNSQ